MIGILLAGLYCFDFGNAILFGFILSIMFYLGLTA